MRRPPGAPPHRIVNHRRVPAWTGGPDAVIPSGMDRPLHVTPVARITLDRFAGVPGEEIFAVGDVHGRSDLLELAFRAVEATPRVEGLPRRLVLLGDLIDRGHAGVACLDMAMGAADRLGHAVTPLMGNHEMMLAIVLTEGLPRYMRAAYLKMWVQNGGSAVLDELESAGHDLNSPSPTLVAYALGPERIAFLQGLANHYRPVGSDVLFVHAGLHPYVDLDEFLAKDWREHADPDFSEDRSWAWVREPFLDRVPRDFGGGVGHHGVFVVHGHTPQDGINVTVPEQVRRDRLNLDVMAVYRERLRCARIVGREVEVFEVTSLPTRV